MCVCSSRAALSAASSSSKTVLITSIKSCANIQPRMTHSHIAVTHKVTSERTRHTHACIITIIHPTVSMCVCVCVCVCVVLLGVGGGVGAVLNVLANRNGPGLYLEELLNSGINSPSN